MKKIEFETSKGKFLLIDLQKPYVDGFKATKLGYRFFSSLEKITEEQASEIVENVNDKKFIRYSDYTRRCDSAINSLHSLLKSKGVHLFKNPYYGLLGLEFPTAKHKAEQKTFHNPYIFKIG